MAKTKRNYINADDALNAGLNLEVAPYDPKEVVADKDGKYLGLNGTTIDDMQFVGTGQYINNTNWDKMAPGYSVVTNPYMAATPDQISKRQQASQKSTGTNDMTLMGDEAYSSILQYQKDWADAQARGDQAAMDAAHAAAEAVRAKYGYSGGADGSEHLGLMAYTKDLYAEEEDDDRDWGGSSGGFGGSGMGGGFSYEDAPQYLSKYQERIDALADAILNRPAFSYDPETDPTYQQYKAGYIRDGKRAMQDTLAQVSARTGGMASSYGVGASQHTFNNYMAHLADKIPELKQLAYSMYMDDLNQDRAELSMLQGMEQTDYGKFLDKLGQWNTDRGFDYGVYRDDVADSQWQTQFDYGVHRDNVADSQWQQQFDYNAQQDALAQQNYLNQLQTEAGNTAYDRAMQMLLMGINPGEAILGQAGIDGAAAQAIIGANMPVVKTPAAGTVGTPDTEASEEPTAIDSTEGLAFLREMERDGASVQELYDMLTELYRNGLITEEAYNRRLDRYRVN